MTSTETAKRFIVKENRDGDWIVVDTKRSRTVVITPTWTDANSQAELRNLLAA